MLTIASRHDWGARPPKRQPQVIETPTAEVWAHHTAGALDAGGNGVWWDDVRGIQNFHMDGRGWDDIAYSFVIGGGQIFEGRGVGIRGAHTGGRNSVSHGICVIGHYDHMQPHEQDLQAFAELLAHGRRQGWWGHLTGPHRDAPGAATSCCGANLIARLDDIRREAAKITSSATPMMEAEIMTPEQERKLDRLLQLAEAGAGRIRTVDDKFAQSGERDDVWNWTGESVTHLRVMRQMLTTDRIASKVLAGIKDGDLDDDQIRAAVRAGIDEAFAEAFGADS